MRAREEFAKHMSAIAEAIAERPLDEALQSHLASQFPPDGELFRRVEALCVIGETEGWLCARAAGGIRFGRAVRPGQEAGDFSVDVVRMPACKGPHHVHPEGEIGMIMPLEGEARFDGMARGWYVYPAGSAHWPTVSGGAAYVLYLLPSGKIEFTGR